MVEPQDPQPPQPPEQPQWQPPPQEPPAQQPPAQPYQPPPAQPPPGQQPYQPPQPPPYQPPQQPGQQPYQAPSQPGQQPYQPPQYGQQPQPAWQQGPTGVPAKRVGAGGCLVSIAVFVLSCIAFFGLITWAIVGTVNSLKDAPAIALGDIGQVNITQTGEQFIFLGNTDGGTIPAVNPDITVTGPDGNIVPLSRNVSSSGNSGGATFRSVAEFTATQTGTYTVDSTNAQPRSGVNLYVTNIDIANIGVKVGLAFLIGGLLLILSIILGIVWLVRRSRNKRVLPA